MDAIKKIISDFIKKNPGEITHETLINRNAIQGSILIHRMYAALAGEGYKVENYHTVNTFGDLLGRIGGAVDEQTSLNHQQTGSPMNSQPTNAVIRNGIGLGIDIE